MRRRLFNLAAAVSLLLCIGSMVLWVLGRGRAQGWYFKPSHEFVIQPPDPSQPSKWLVQWQINWGDDGWLTIDRQVKPTEPERIGRIAIGAFPMRIGYFTAVMGTTRWNPLPPELPRPFPSGTSPIVWSQGNRIMAVIYPRTKPSTTVRFLRAEYVSSEQEFAHFPQVNGIPERYVNYSGERLLRVPLLNLFIVFALLPCVWSWRTARDWRRRQSEGYCRSCGYNLSGNISGVCPECGMPVVQKSEGSA